MTFQHEVILGAFGALIIWSLIEAVIAWRKHDHTRTLSAVLEAVSSAILFLAVAVSRTHPQWFGPLLLVYLLLRFGRATVRMR